MKVILVIWFSIWWQKPRKRLTPCCEEPGEIFHHARSTKRELLLTLRGTRQSHPHAAASRLSNGDGITASRRRQWLLQPFRVHRLRFESRRIACLANSVGRLQRTRKVAEFYEATATTPAGRDVAQRGRRPRRRCPAGGRSHPVTAAAVIAGECVRSEIIRAVAVAAVRDTCADRRTRAPQRGPVARQPGRTSWRPSIQNVQIGIIEREQARLLDGSLRKCRRRRRRGQQTRAGAEKK
jgi:hypothetical protein